MKASVPPRRPNDFRTHIHIERRTTLQTLWRVTIMLFLNEYISACDNFLKWKNGKRGQILACLVSNNSIPARMKPPRVETAPGAYSYLYIRIPPTVSTKFSTVVQLHELYSQQLQAPDLPRGAATIARRAWRRRDEATKFSTGTRVYVSGYVQLYYM